ncbi:MAG: hypothetical protein QOD74_2026 [Variibacter sp.]|nr:hypothetical protein [Variibacter sp.]
MSDLANKRDFVLRLLACAAACALAGCAGDSAYRDWSWWNNNAVRMDPLTPGPVSPNSLVTPDGSCAGEGAVPPGVALGMTECDLVRLAGPGPQIDIAANARGERETIITYRSGDRPGIYRFAAGRLTEVERAPEPPPKPKPQRGKPKPRQSAVQTFSAS